ncbi:MAG: prepilin-type N-terminal cleavage/methylation domain-containing protein [Planctomycetaceae bacterium]|nr:prepilin-type N-terminal cleavage/methylation domain-containing protein [Planctomycetaceae bacterium]
MRLTCLSGRRCKKDGFTLVEALFAAMLLGVVIAALAASSGAFTMANGYGMDLSTAEFLIEESRDMLATLPAVDPETQKDVFGHEADETSTALYDDVDDFHNVVFSPPVDISRAAMNEFAGFAQQITVQNVDAVNLTATAADHSTDFVRVTVTILRNNVPMTSTSWIRANY